MCITKSNAELQKELLYHNTVEPSDSIREFHQIGAGPGKGSNSSEIFRQGSCRNLTNLEM
jgi:hypothetical protein